MASTPTIKGINRIELAWLESDQRDYFRALPPNAGNTKCSRSAMARVRGWCGPKRKPDDAMYRCAGCLELIPHHLKAGMVERGEYRAQNPSSPIPGFRVSQLISPKKPWGEIAVEFLAAKRSPETLAQGLPEHGSRGRSGKTPTRRRQMLMPFGISL